MTTTLLIDEAIRSALSSFFHLATDGRPAIESIHSEFA